MIAFIPARSGSRGIPHKNIKHLGGKPLLAWSIEFALKCGLRPVVSSESEIYLKIAEEYGAETLLRHPALAEDNTPMFDVLKHEVLKIEPKPEVIVILQPTTPFRNVEDLQQALKMLDEADKTSVISVSPVPAKYHPEEVIMETPDGYAMATGVPILARKTRRQDYARAFVPTGAFYVLKASNLAGGSIYGDKVGIFETAPTVNINERADWVAAEEIARKV
jgi:CMP-N,N'-diacetyllegionaminic acid synthase